MGKTAIILFDGVCNLCNSSINFVIDRDPEHRFRYAALQSTAGNRLMKKHGLHPEELSSIVLIEDDKVFRKSTAILRIAWGLNNSWPLLYAFIIIPAFIRNLVYDLIANNRYQWFGKQNECRIPTPELKKLFLED